MIARVSTSETAQSEFGKPAHGRDVKPKVHPLRLLVSLVFGAIGVLVSAWILPGLEVHGFGSALVVAIVLGAFNAVFPPLLAALRLPYTVALTFLLVLAADAAALLIADAVTEGDFVVDGFFSALVAAVVISGVTTVLAIVFGVNDDDAYSLSVVNRIAHRSGERVETDVPGILYLEIDGLAMPILQRAMRDGNAPNMARWLAEDTHRLVEWETDLSSQTGASQAGILLGSNENIPAFRWVEKDRGVLMVCSNPDNCAEIERRHAGDGLLREGGASRGNLLSGEADYALLTASRVSAEKKANPGYRAFFANGFNVTRTLVLVFWEIVLELVASERQRRRDVQPRGHRGGVYPLIRAGMCIFIRDLTVYAVLSDMFKGRPAVYATFASYDEVAHHSGLERPDTLEALRKLDQQFGRLDRARRYAPRPYHVVVLSDHGQTQGATFKQRNGYALEELVRRSVEAGDVRAVASEDEGRVVVGTAFDEATGQGEESGKKRGPKSDVSGEEVVVLGSGNLGLVYLMDEPRRLTLEEIEKLHPRLIPALREHPHVGFLVVALDCRRPAGARGTRRPPPRRRSDRGRGPARHLLSHRRAAPPQVGRVLERARHLREQLLRPGARGGLRVRGADLLPRRHGRTADATLPARAGRAPVARGADRGRRRRPRSAQGLARAAPAVGAEHVGGRRARRHVTRITYVGHATVLVAMDDVRLLTDPLLRTRVAHLRRRGKVDVDALRGVDSVLVSHGHYDHLDLPSLERLGRSTPVVVPRGLGRLLRRRGFEHVVETDAGERLTIGKVTVEATLALHEGSRMPFGARGPALGYLISGSHRLYFAGDTDLFDEMSELAEGLDVALVPIWGWGPSLGRGGHLDPEGAAKALALLQPRIAIPIHWGTYHPLHIGLVDATDFLHEPPLRFVEAAAEAAPDVEVRVLELGESLEL